MGMIQSLRDAVMLRWRALQIAGDLPALSRELIELRALRGMIQQQLEARGVAIITGSTDQATTDAANALLNLWDPWYEQWAYGKQPDGLPGPIPCHQDS